MLCRECGHPDSTVLDLRAVDGNVRSRRECNACREQELEQRRRLVRAYASPRAPIIHRCETHSDADY